MVRPPLLAALALLAPRACAVLFRQGAQGAEQIATDGGDVAHVVITADKEYKKEPAMRSVLQHASGPVKLYTFVADNDVNNSVPHEVNGHPVEVIHFTRKDIKPYINLAYKAQKTDYGDPKSLHNYARYIIADKLPGVGKALYLDADTITTLDVNKFLREHLNDGQVVAGFPRTHRNHYDGKLESMRAKGLNFTAQNATFSTGVLAWNLAKFREGQWNATIQKFVAANNKYKWWTSTLQPPLHLILGSQKFEQLPTSLIVEEMGLTKGGPVADTPGGRFYHWQGPKKAWTYAGFHKKLYGQYTDAAVAAAATGTEAPK